MYDIRRYTKHDEGGHLWNGFSFHITKKHTSLRWLYRPHFFMDLTLFNMLCSSRYSDCRVLELEPAVPMVGVTITLNTASPLTKVRVSLSVVPPIRVSQQTATFSSLTASDTMQLHAYLADQHIVSSLQLSVVVTYLTHQAKMSDMSVSWPVIGH